MVFLPVAFDSSMEQYEIEMERFDLYFCVDGISTSLVVVGLPAGVQGLEHLHTIVVSKPTVLGCKHLCSAYGN